MYSIGNFIRGVACSLQKSPAPRDHVSRRSTPWLPRAGAIVSYAGRSREMRTVRLVAEASAGWMIVEAIGRDAISVRFSVKRRNFDPLQPGFFDHEPAI